MVYHAIYAMQESGLLSRILSNEFPESVHERMLVALKDMMTAEEHRLEDNAAMQVNDPLPHPLFHSFPPALPPSLVLPLALTLLLPLILVTG